MEDDRKLPEEAMQLIEDHLDRLEAQLEQRVRGMENQAIRMSVVIGVLIMLLLFLLLRAWDKL